MRMNVHRFGFHSAVGDEQEKPKKVSVNKKIRKQSIPLEIFFLLIYKRTD
jgi:hypothetical protein